MADEKLEAARAWAASENGTSIALPEKPKRKPRADKGHHRKEKPFYLLTDRDDVDGGGAVRRVITLVTENGTAKVFETPTDLTQWLAANAKLNEWYQPVEAFGESWGYQIGQVGRLL